MFLFALPLPLPFTIFIIPLFWTSLALCLDWTWQAGIAIEAAADLVAVACSAEVQGGRQAVSMFQVVAVRSEGLVGPVPLWGTIGVLKNAALEGVLQHRLHQSMRI